MDETKRYFFFDVQSQTIKEQEVNYPSCVVPDDPQPGTCQEPGGLGTSALAHSFV